MFSDNPIYEIFQKDSRDILKEIPTESVDLIVSDVPYPTTKRGGKSSTMGGYWNSELVNKGKIFNNNSIKPSEYLSELYRVLKDGTHCYIMINNLNLIEMLNEGLKVGFKFIKLLAWDKTVRICGTYYMGQIEHIIMFRKGKGRPINNCGTSDLLSVPIHKLKDAEGHNLHDTEKPVELMEILINNSSNEGDIVLDPFMGIGSTGVASIKNKRRFIGIEIDPTYFEIAKSRLEKESAQSKTKSLIDYI